MYGAGGEEFNGVDIMESSLVPSGQIALCFSDVT